MKQTFKIVAFLFFISSTTQLLAQFDKNNGNNSKGNIKAVIESNAQVTEKPISINIKSNDGFKGAYNNEQEKLKKKQEEEAFNKKEILTKAQLNNLRIKEMYGKQTIEKVDSHQGDFLTKSNSLTLSFRDFGAIDGDVIAIFLNGAPIITKTTLNHHYKSYNIPLRKDNNTIEIVALNQGSLGANTAQYKLVNTSGIKIASQYWFLATGAKATFNVTKSE